MIDISSDPYCAASLNGLKINLHLPGDAQGDSSAEVGSGQGDVQKMAKHYILYKNPIMAAIGAFSDNPCLDKSPFDILAFSAVNPAWMDPALSTILNPDSFLYGSLAAVLSAIPVGTCSTLDDNDPTCNWIRRTAHWSVGFNGATYPLQGELDGRSNTISASMNIAKRAFALGQRTLTIWGGSGDAGMCGYYPKPLIDDTDYKLTMVGPAQEKPGLDGRCCQPFGASTLLWGAGKFWPITGENQSYVVFRKRDCCMAGASITP